MANSESITGNWDMIDNEITHETLDNIIIEAINNIRRIKKTRCELHLWISQQRTA